MYKMVIQAVLLSGAAIFFIATKSDGLRSASQSGDFSSLAQVAAGNGEHDGLGGLSGMADAFKGEFEWANIDPRRLWNERPKTLKVTPKTIRVDSDAAPVDQTAFLASQGLDPSSVTVVKLD